MDERVTDDKIIIVQTQGRTKPLWRPELDLAPYSPPPPVKLNLKFKGAIVDMLG